MVAVFVHRSARVVKALQISGGEKSQAFTASGCCVLLTHAILRPTPCRTLRRMRLVSGKIQGDCILTNSVSWVSRISGNISL